MLPLRRRTASRSPMRALPSPRAPSWARGASSRSSPGRRGGWPATPSSAATRRTPSTSTRPGRTRTRESSVSFTWRPLGNLIASLNRKLRLTRRIFRALDREKRAQYILTVAADLPDTASTATFRVFVAVLDINDNPPVFDQVRKARSHTIREFIHVPSKNEKKYTRYLSPVRV